MQTVAEPGLAMVAAQVAGIVLWGLVLFMLNGVRSTMNSQSEKLEQLTNKVLAEYMPRADMIALFNATREDYHHVNDNMHAQATNLALLKQLFEMDHQGLIIKTVPLKERKEG